MVLIPGSGENSASRLFNSRFAEVAEEMGFVVVAFNPVVILPNNYSAQVYADVRRAAEVDAGWRIMDNIWSLRAGTVRYLNGSAGYNSAQSGAPSGDVRPNAIDLTGEFLTETISAFKIDDVGYICALVDRFVENGRPQESSVFASGLSHGAYMTLRLAAQRPDVFAGAAPVAGLLDVGHQITFDGKFNPVTDNKVKLVFIQGDADAIVPAGERLKTAAENVGPNRINDGRRALFDIKGDPPGLNGPTDPGGSQGLEESVDWFMKQYGLGPAVRTASFDIPHADVTVPNSTINLLDITEVSRYEYNGGQAIVYWVKGGGHSWPGGMPTGTTSAVFSTVSYQIDATRVMMEDLWINFTATADASVSKLNGNKNELTISITKVYDNGKVDVVTKSFMINNNAADTYQVDDYKVYVDTKGNTQIRECIIVEDVFKFDIAA